LNKVFVKIIKFTCFHSLVVPPQNFFGISTALERLNVAEVIDFVVYSPRKL